ncbi:MAG: hypothetical protein N2383_03015 [Caldilineales bacterium]|nr:hypothetical protein [Caldilineales bacterium]
MGHELRTLLWLQGRLLRNSLRRGTAQDTGRLVGVLFLGVLMVPGLLVMAVVMAVGLRLTDIVLGGHILALAFTFILLIWLTMPASQQQMTEPLDLTRLFHLPIAFRHLVLASLVLNSIGLTALSTGFFLLAAIVGFLRAGWQAAPMALSALAFFGVVVVLKAVVDDVLALAAADRRLRLLIIVVSLAPVLLIVYGQLSFQIGLLGGGPPPDPAVYLAQFDLLRWVSWAPSGWLAQAFVALRRGGWWPWLGWTMALLAVLVAGLGLHLRLMRRLFFGNLWRVAMRRRSAPRRSRLLAWASALGRRRPWLGDWLVLLWKDWLNFARSPITARLFFLPVILCLAGYFFGRVSLLPGWSIGLGLAGFTAFFVTLMAHDQIGTYDHVGVGALLLSPAPRVLILLSYGLLNLAVAVALALAAGLTAWLARGEPVVLGYALALIVPLQLVCNGLTHLTSLVFPYYMDLERGQAPLNEAKASFFTVFSAMVGMPLLTWPIVLPVGLGRLLAPAWTPLFLGFALVYGVAAYALLLKVAARLFPSREEKLVETMLARR